MNKEAIKILEEKKVIFAYIFGSQAYGNTHKNSDFDIAIYLNEDNKTERFETKLYLMGKLPSKLGKKVDIVVLNDLSSNYLLKEIIHSGKLILNNNENLHFDFFCKAQHKVCDFFEHLRFMKKNVFN